MRFGYNFIKLLTLAPKKWPTDGEISKTFFIFIYLLDFILKIINFLNIFNQNHLFINDYIFYNIYKLFLEIV